MSEIICKGTMMLQTNCGKCSKCYEEVLSQLAALREELATAKSDEKMFKDEDLKWQLIRELGAEINDLKVKCEEKEKSVQYLHQRAIISSQAATSLRNQLELSEQRLADAERRNAELKGLLQATKTVLSNELSYELFRKLDNHFKRIDAALNKPE